MTIRYADGKAVEGILLRRTGTAIRVAVPGSDDVLEFTQANQVWVSEDCEPVRIEFSWQRNRKAGDTLPEDDFICSHELAARLLHLLWNDSDEDDWPSEPVAPAAGLAPALTRRLMLN